MEYHHYLKKSFWDLEWKESVERIFIRLCCFFYIYIFLWCKILWFYNSFAVQDGKLRVFKWPSLDVLFSEEEAYTSVKDLHFRFISLAAEINGETLELLIVYVDIWHFSFLQYRWEVSGLFRKWWPLQGLGCNFIKSYSYFSQGECENSNTTFPFKSFVSCNL